MDKISEQIPHQKNIYVMSWVVFPPKSCIEILMPAFQNVTRFVDKVFRKWQIKTRPFRWALNKLTDIFIRRDLDILCIGMDENPGRTQREGSYLQSNQRGFRGNQTCQQLDFGLSPPELWEYIYFCCLSHQFAIFCYGSHAKVIRYTGGK